MHNPLAPRALAPTLAAPQCRPLAAPCVALHAAAADPDGSDAIRLTSNAWPRFMVEASRCLQPIPIYAARGPPLRRRRCHGVRCFDRPILFFRRTLPLFSFPRPPTEQQQQAVGRAEDGKKRRRRPCSGSGSSSRQRASGIRFVCPSSAGTSVWQAEAADRQCRRAVIRVAQEAQQGPIPRLPLPSSNQREDSSSSVSNS